MQALILAGGAGTRLRSMLGDALNKPMAPVAGKPFLEYLIVWLQQQGVDDIVLCVGYRASLIQSHFGAGAPWGVHLTYSREAELLGTGGAVKLAQDRVRGDEVLVLNGDSFLDVDLGAVAHVHRAMDAAATLALTTVDDGARYGRVRVDDAHRIVGFDEKTSEARRGLINGGIYVLTRAVIDAIPGGRTCSLERDVFPALIGRHLYGHRSPGYFIDIGVPADYARLQADPSPLLAAVGKRRQAP